MNTFHGAHFKMDIIVIQTSTNFTKCYERNILIYRALHSFLCPKIENKNGPRNGHIFIEIVCMIWRDKK